MEYMNGKELATLAGGKILCGNSEITISSVTTNSKEVTEGTLFVPIIGEKVDGHRFIGQAVQSGATAIFTAREDVVGDCQADHNPVVILVDNTLQALQKVAAGYHKRLASPVVGITGSVGKTTTKEMIAAALHTKHILKTAGNMNSQVGLPLMLLRLQEEHELAVLEMGMSEPGEMARLAVMATPETMVVTNIGVAHIAQLKTRENIRKEKLNSINQMRAGGTLILNGDDVLLCALKDAPEQVELADETRDALHQANILTYGLQENCDFYAENIRILEGGYTAFLAHGVQNGEPFTVPVMLHVLGSHNVGNALAALAVASCYGIAPEDAAKGLAEYRPLAMRGQILNRNGVTWIDDTYNASPDSMRSGSQVLLSIPAGRHIAVLADVLELGEESQRLHREVGEFLADLSVESRSLDCLVTVGEQAKYIAAGIQKNEHICVKECQNNTEAATFLKDYLKEQDAVFVKGSRGMHTEEILAAFME